MIGKEKVNCPSCNYCYTKLKLRNIKYSGYFKVFGCLDCGEPLKVGYYMLDGSMSIESRQLKLELK